MRGTESKITCTVAMTEAQAQRLWSTAFANFVTEQPHRFEYDAPDDPSEDCWRAGTMYWCESAADAFLLEAFEQACGHRSMCLWDMGMAALDQDARVVLSARPWPVWAQ